MNTVTYHTIYCIKHWWKILINRHHPLKSNIFTGTQWEGRCWWGQSSCLSRCQKKQFRSDLKRLPLPAHFNRHSHEITNLLFMLVFMSVSVCVWIALRLSSDKHVELKDMFVCPCSGSAKIIFSYVNHEKPCSWMWSIEVVFEDMKVNM